MNNSLEELNKLIEVETIVDLLPSGQGPDSPDTFSLPKQLRNPAFRFVETHPKGVEYGKDSEGKPLISNGKIPVGKWSENLLTYGSERLKRQLRKKKTYAVATGHGGLVVIDVDHEQGRAILEHFPKTFTVLSGSKKLPHIYLKVTGNEQPPRMVRKVPLTAEQVDAFAHKVLDQGTKALTGLRLETLFDVQGRNALAIGPNSRPDESTRYEIHRDVDIAEVTPEELSVTIGRFGTTDAEQKQVIIERAKALSPEFKSNMEDKGRGTDQDTPWNSELWKEIKRAVGVSHVYAHFGKSMHPSASIRHECLLGHASKSNQDVLCSDDRRWYCFNCQESGDVFKLFHQLMGTHDKTGKSAWLQNSIAFAGLAGEDCQRRWKEYLDSRRQAHADHLRTQETGTSGDVTDDEETLLQEMNQRFFIARHNGKVQVLEETTNPSGYFELVPYTESGFRLKFANRLVKTQDGNDRNGNPKYKFLPLAERWRTWDGRRTYELVGFWPGNLNPEHQGRYYNLWKGFSVLDAPGEFPLLEYHLRHIWCRGDESQYRYLITWLAHLVQRPWEKPGVALVIKGGKGVGKSIIFEKVLQKILGGTYSKIDKPRQVTGQFNNHQFGKLLLVLEEAIWAGNKEAEGTLKSMITETRTLYEPKGVDAYDGDSYVRLAFVSNEKRAVPASIDERRYFALMLSPEKQNDTSYFSRLLAEIDSGGLQAFMHYLQTFEFDPQDVRTPPQTRALFEDILEGLSLFEKWAYDLLHIDANGKDESGASIKWGDTVATQDLFDNYKAWVEEMKRSNVYVPHGHIGTQTKLTQEMKRFFGFRSTKQNGLNCFCLPPLKEARAVFASKVRASVEWETEVNDWVDDLLDNQS